MDIRDRVFGPIVRHVGPDTISVDFGDLVRKLILSEQFVLESYGLDEFLLLIEKFDYDGVLALLDSGLIRVQCELAGMASLDDGSRAGSRLPLGSYQFGIFRVPPERSIERGLATLRETPYLSEKKARILCRKLAGCIIEPRPAGGEMLLSQLHADIEMESPILKAAVAQIARGYVARPVKPGDFSFAACLSDRAIPGNGVLSNFQAVQTETDLSERLGLDDQEALEVVERGLHSVGNLNQRFELMERLEAVTGFQPRELELFEQKLTFLARQLDPRADEERFARVADVADLPDVDPDPSVRDVDLSRLVEIVQKDEARAFREWLRSIDTMSNQEIRAEIHRVRELVRTAVRSPAGKAIRFGLTTGAGLIPHAGVAAGPASTALDSFVVDSLISKPGPTAFVSNLYPSIFVEKT
jgi:hypothetical protein